MDGAGSAHPRERADRQSDGPGDVQSNAAEAVRRKSEQPGNRIRAQRQRLQFDLVTRDFGCKKIGAAISTIAAPSLSVPLRGRDN